jgi:GntR family transcriptional regulator
LLVHIDPAEPRPIYVQIVDEVRRAIVLEAVRPGEALPSVRQLASELRVNPNTVRQAYGELERAGVLEVRRGQGTFVRSGAVPEGERSALVASVAGRALRDAFRHGLTVSELIEALKTEAGRGRVETSRKSEEVG